MEHLSGELGIILAAVVGAFLVMTRIGRILLPLITIFFIGVTLASLYAMIVAPPRSGAGVFIIPAFLGAIFAWIAGNLWMGVRENQKLMKMPEEDRKTYSLEIIDRMIPELEEEIRVKSEKAQGFWISSRKRSALKSDVQQAEFFLKGLRTARKRLETQSGKASAEIPISGETIFD